MRYLSRRRSMSRMASTCETLTTLRGLTGAWRSFLTLIANSFTILCVLKNPLMQFISLSSTSELSFELQTILKLSHVLLDFGHWYTVWDMSSFIVTPHSRHDKQLSFAMYLYLKSLLLVLSILWRSLNWKSRKIEHFVDLRSRINGFWAGPSKCPAHSPLFLVS